MSHLWMRHYVRTGAGLFWGSGGRVPFTKTLLLYVTTAAVNVQRGLAAAPFAIPAAPRRNRCFALRSPPDRLPAVGSTRHPVSIRLWPPSLASSPCHPVSGSPISAGTQHPCHIQTAEKVEGAKVRLKIAEALTAGWGEAHGCAERA